MSRIATILLWVVLIAGDVYACDVCGCATGGFSSGLNALQNPNFVGLRFQERAFVIEHPPLFASDPQEFSNDRFQTLELTGRYMPHRNLQLMAFIPVHRFQKEHDSEATVFTGMGDATLLVSSVFQSKDTAGNRFAYRFSAGGGVKLPTGKYDQLDPESGLIIPGMQLGTGSFDFLLHIVYAQRIYRWGILTESSFRINTPNRLDYRFGNRWSNSIQGVRWIALDENERFVLRPSLGLLWEWAAQDHDGPQTWDVNEYSGGYFVDATAGVNLLMNQFNFGCTFQHPIRQYYAEGFVNKQWQVSAQVNYLFKSKT